VNAILDLLKQAGVNAHYTEGSMSWRVYVALEKFQQAITPDHCIVMMASLLTASADNHVGTPNVEAVKSYASNTSPSKTSQ